LENHGYFIILLFCFLFLKLKGEYYRNGKPPEKNEKRRDSQSHPNQVPFIYFFFFEMKKRKKKRKENVLKKERKKRNNNLIK